MAETPNPKKAVPEKKAAPEKKATPGGALKPDVGSLAGLALALAGILGGLLLEKGKLQDVAQGTAAMIVLGGTFGAVMVTSPFPVFLRAIGRLGAIFFERGSPLQATIDALIQYAAKARKNGIVSLETETPKITDPFLRKALDLAVDGTDLQELRKMMDVDLSATEEASEAEAKVWESAGGYAPTVGIIGAVMGLIQVMKHLEDIKAVGHGIAVAFVATVYGVGSANLFFLPAANKLRARTRQASVVKEVILEGVAGIVEGLNPTLIRMKLESFDPQAQKSKKSKQAASGKAAAAKAAPQAAPARN